MYINNPYMETKVINGQMVYIANVEWWELFIQTNKSKDIPIMLSASMSEWIQSHLDFARYYMELVIAVRFVGVLGWVPLFLLKIADGLQRVHLEKLLCEICGWQGMTANPLVSDLYSGVPDKQAALEATYKYSVLPCPKCGSKLPRYPIWVEPLKDSDSHTQLQIEEKQ